MTISPSILATWTLLVLALNLALDVLLGDLRPPVDVPRVHDHADTPSGDGEHRPEEPVIVAERPDRHQERVDQHIDQNMTAEVAPLLQLRDRPVVSRLLTCVGNHGEPSPSERESRRRPGHGRGQRLAQADLRPAGSPLAHPRSDSRVCHATVTVRCSCTWQYRGVGDNPVRAAGHGRPAGPSLLRRSGAARRALVTLEMTTGATGLAGGVLLAVAPDGSLLRADPDALAGSPFRDWRVP